MAADLAFASPSTTVLVPTDVSSSTITMNFNARIRNQGDQNANLTGSLSNLNDNFVVRIYASTNNSFDASDILVKEFKISDSSAVILGPNQVMDFPFSGNLTVSAQNQYLLFQIDATNVVPEGNESNNLTAFTGKNPYLLVTRTVRTVEPKKTILLDETAAIIDLDSVDLGNSRLEITQNNFQNGDTLGIQPTKLSEGKLKLSKDKIRVGKTVVGTLTKDDRNESVTLTFGENADRKLVFSVIRAVTFKSAKGAVGTRSFYTTFYDPDGNSSVTGEVKINVA